MYKSNDAVPKGKKVGNGRLCYNVSNMNGHYENLDKIGKMAVVEVASDLDLVKEKTGGVATPARVCTLADLSLRLLDRARITGRRFFYRPISALKSKHEGKASK